MFETRLKLKYNLLVLICLCLGTACQPAAPACPAGSVTYVERGTSSLESPPAGSQAFVDQLVEINGREMLVDQVVKGPLCNHIWTGNIYVPCQIEIYTWEEDPNFLADCDLDIAPGTVVYVAAHNDEPYYQGCSCHTGEDGQ